MTITDDRLRELIAETREGRQNAKKRAIRTDAEAALAGSDFCRQVMTERDDLAGLIVLPPDLRKAIEEYQATDYSDGRDPSKLGALNAVAYIGERLVAVWGTRKPR